MSISQKYNASSFIFIANNLVITRILLERERERESTRTRVKLHKRFESSTKSLSGFSG